MRIDILTLFPDMFTGIFTHSILKRAIQKGILDVKVHDIRDYSLDKHRRVDDYPFGGEAGMVMMIEPIDRCINKLKIERNYDAVLFMTPDAPVFNQQTANRFSLMKNIIILCGHYKGVDERVRELLVTEEVSMGDFVLSGGEIPSMAIVDAIVRVIPGVLNDEESALSDSFQDGLLSAPVYTRPSDYQGHKVPSVLLSGDEKRIKAWKLEQQYKRTEERRPDLL
jgi:tRNA (guanine37-N1)-methyltransferase